MNQNITQQPVEYRPAVVPERRGCGCFGGLLLIGFFLLTLACVWRRNRRRGVCLC